MTRRLVQVVGCCALLAAGRGLLHAGQDLRPQDGARLEQKLATLVAHTRALRAANESLRRELAAATARNQTLAGRVAEAKQRLDALMARFPETAA